MLSLYTWELCTAVTQGEPVIKLVRHVLRYHCLGRTLQINFYTVMSHPVYVCGSWQHFDGVTVQDIDSFRVTKWAAEPCSSHTWQNPCPWSHSWTRLVHAETTQITVLAFKFSKHMRAAIILAGRWAMSLLETTKDMCWINCAWSSSMYVVYKWRYQLGTTLCILDNRQQMLVLWAAAFSIGSPWPPSRQPHNVPLQCTVCLCLYRHTSHDKGSSQVIHLPTCR